VRRVFSLLVATLAKSDRTGFPVTTPFPTKEGNAFRKITAAARTNRASCRLVNPGSAFAQQPSSKTSQGRDHQPLVRMITTDSDHHVSLYVLTRANGKKLLGNPPATRSVSDPDVFSNPQRQSIRAQNLSEESIFDVQSPRFPTNRISAVEFRSLNSLAMATPGYMCPPVPPPAMITLNPSGSPVRSLA